MYLLCMRGWVSKDGKTSFSASKWICSARCIRGCYSISMHREAETPVAQYISLVPILSQQDHSLPWAEMMGQRGWWGSLNVCGTAEMGMVWVSCLVCLVAFLLVPNWVSSLCCCMWLTEQCCCSGGLNTALSLCPDGTRCPLLLSCAWYLTLAETCACSSRTKEGHTQAPCHEIQAYQNKGGEVGRGQSLPNWHDTCHQSDVDFYARADVEASR